MIVLVVLANLRKLEVYVLFGASHRKVDHGQMPVVFTEQERPCYYFDARHFCSLSPTILDRTNSLPRRGLFCKVTREERAWRMSVL